MFFEKRIITYMPQLDIITFLPQAFHFGWIIIVTFIVTVFVFLPKSILRIAPNYIRYRTLIKKLEAEGSSNKEGQTATEFSKNLKSSSTNSKATIYAINEAKKVVDNYRVK